jgi:hypothetical protein
VEEKIKLAVAVPQLLLAIAELNYITFRHAASTIPAVSVFDS